MLIIKILDAEYPCPACGKLVEMDFEYRFGQRGEIECPWCGETVFCYVSVALVDMFYLKSNAEQLLDMAGIEADQAREIEEMKTEEPVNAG